MDKIKAGIIGCGNISDIYLKNLTDVFKTVEVKACADLIIERAKEKTEKYNIPFTYTVEEMLNDKEIEMILNLTIPQAHTEVNLKALNAGKHVYCEKPFALNMEDAKKVLVVAKETGLYVGCAPDTFLGAGIQTCRKIIDDGWIGKPIAATAFMTCAGHESWHPGPEFYYKAGGGPMLDMGPYYITALINLLGPINKVAGLCKKSRDKRIITSQPKYGEVIDVDVDTHVTGLLDFECSAVGTIITSFDVWASNLPRIEVYGTLGSLSVPDPNTFGNAVKLKRFNSENWELIPYSHIYNENSRGLGFVDMAHAIREGKNNRASGELATHVLEAMLGIISSSDKSEYISLETRCSKPEPMPMDILKGYV